MLCLMKRVQHLGIVWALCACSGHQTYDDCSDALGGKRRSPEPMPVDGAVLFDNAVPAISDGGSQTSVVDASVASTKPPIDEPDVTQSAEAGTPMPVLTGDPVLTLPDTDAGNASSDGGACVSGQYPEFAFTPEGLFCESVAYCPNGDVVSLPAVSEPLPCYTGGGHECGTQLDDGGFMYRYEQPPVKMFQRFSLAVWFDPQLGQEAFSDAALTEHFTGLEVRRLTVGETSGESLSVCVDRIWEPQEAFDAGLVFQNGRLVGTLNGIFEEAYYDWAETRQDECLTDDIVHNCECNINGLAIPFNLEFDVSLTPINTDAG